MCSQSIGRGFNSHRFRQTTPDGVFFLTIDKAARFIVKSLPMSKYFCQAGIPDLIAKAEFFLKNEDEATPIVREQIISMIFVELNLNKGLLAVLPSHLRREYDRVEKEIEQKKQQGDMVGVLTACLEMLRLVQAARSLQKTPRQGFEKGI